ncbi:MAG: IS200/IS605 family transposase [Bacteroidetes bacterium]|nr:IS200/IS605 family transposase [Bacteroidota bacterium]
MPYIKIWIHLIFSTKNGDKLISKQLKPQLLKHIKENSIKKNMYIDFMNCVSDHIHLLISLNSEQTISKVTRLIKGQSSHWINNYNLIPNKFEWQDEYIAVSICHSQVNMVRDYIKNQEEHHRKKTFQEEYDEFIKKYGFEIIGK